jgi:hypothetical protein
LKVSPPRAAKKFDVQFDPSRVTVAQMLAAVQGLGYRPSQDGPVVAGVETPAVKVEARAGAAGHRAGAEGAITVKLSAKAGARLGGDGQAATRVAVVGTDMVVVPTPEAQVAEAVTGDRELTIPIRIAEKASAGEQTVTVRITFQSRKGDKSEAEQTVELRVPVVVQ